MTWRATGSLLLIIAWGCTSPSGPPPLADAGNLDTGVDASTDGTVDGAADGATDGDVDSAVDLCADVDCATFEDACHSATCDPDTGECVATPVDDGTACDDGDPCTVDDACGAGLCAGDAMDCTALDDDCNVGFCDAPTASCVAVPVADGTVCDDGDLCTVRDRCTAGSCGGRAFDCSALTTGCYVGVCDPTVGGCAQEVARDGTVCDDGDPCTHGDLCTAGVCAGTAGTCSAITPGRTDQVVTTDGWSVRCLSWSGRVCMHMQVKMACTTCATYPNCDAWHDVTAFNNDDSRTSLNWCALATGDSTVTSNGRGALALGPLACGWNSRTHPICEAGRATYQSSAPGITPMGGLLLNDSYCVYDRTLLTVECAGW